jgi:hypothetical protein
MRRRRRSDGRGRPSILRGEVAISGGSEMRPGTLGAGDLLWRRELVGWVLLLFSISSQGNKRRYERSGRG